MAKTTSEYAPPESGRWWATNTRAVTRDQIFLGVDGTAWLYMACPLGPIKDARTPDAGLQFGRPIDEAFRQTAALSRAGYGFLARRRLVRRFYRNIHVLLVNVPAQFDPAGVAAETLLRRGFPHTLVATRLLAFGVSLQPDLVGGVAHIQDAIDKVVRTFTDQLDPGEQYQADARRIRAALTRAGLVSLTGQDMSLIDAWWSGGRHPATHILPHPDHLHLYLDAAAAQTAILQDGDCAYWPDLAQGGLLSWATVEKNLANVTHGDDPAAWWGRRLIDAGAACISIRGLLEPPGVTHHELGHQLVEARRDLDEREKHTDLPDDERERQIGWLDSIRDTYSGDQGAPPTLIDATIDVGFTGRDLDEGFNPGSAGEQAGLILDPMEHRQRAAMSEAQICSPVTASPWLQEFPATMVAYAGLADLACLGDKPSPTAALLGFTEEDRQPVWIDHTALYRSGESQASFGIVTGDQGCGKTSLEQWLALQWSHGYNTLGEHTPIIIFDPKFSSDQTPVLSQAPVFRGISLSDMLGVEGIVDGLAVAQTPQAGVMAAHAYLMDVNPTAGSESLATYDSALQSALAFGANRGARFSGAAVKAAADAGQAYAGKIWDLLSMQAEASPMFKAFCGMTGDGEPLRAAEGLTYIRVGEAGLDILGLANLPLSQMHTSQRTQIIFIRALVNAIVYALAGRQGVGLVDEGWAVTSAGQAQLQATNRLIRQLQVSLWLYTQRISDAVKAELAAPAWQIIMGQNMTPAEGAASLQLASLEATTERMGRITAGPRAPGGVANRNSLFPLAGADGQMMRGAVGLTVAPDRQAIYTEITLPDDFIRLSATNLDTMTARQTAAV